MPGALPRIEISALPPLPRVRPGDDLAGMLAERIEQQDEPFHAGSILVVAQKVVSKAEGRIVDLSTVTPGERARELAALVDKDPRLVEVILSESVEVIRHRPGVLIVEHRSGLIAANAGIDRSNVDPDLGEEPVLLLPEDADASAAALRDALGAKTGVSLGVIVCDSVGRAWRNGTVGLALGAAGVPSFIDLRGRSDLFGRTLQVSELGFADSVAAAACLAMGEGDEGIAAVMVSGLCMDAPAMPASALLRPRAQDLFR